MYPVSIKGVLFAELEQVVLLLNERDEWELPGGRLEPDEQPAGCVAREFAEELGIAVRPERLLDSYLFEVIPAKQVLIVTYGCTLDGAFRPRVSEEHLEFGVFPVHALPANLPPGYRESILAWQQLLAA